MARRQTKVLWTVLGINLAMFLVEAAAGLLSGSLALTGDSLDMLGDALAYGSSLYVVSRGTAAKAKAAMLKAGIILASAAGILGTAVYRFVALDMPHAGAMGGIAILALAANAICLLLLTRFKDDDVNMASVWVCSRNDIVANTAVIGAAGLVALTASPWPDLVVGLGLTVLFVRSALKILGASQAELAAARV